MHLSIYYIYFAYLCHKSGHSFIKILAKTKWLKTVSNVFGHANCERKITANVLSCILGPLYGAHLIANSIGIDFIHTER